MQKMDVNELIPHPRNKEFFEDIEGEAWTQFLESVKKDGILEPIIVNQNNMIVSGHQRVRAAKELKLKKVPVVIMPLETEDDVLRVLIESNIRRRGAGSTNPVLFGKCLDELRRIYKGVKTTQKLAEELGISDSHFDEYVRLANSLPEIKELLETGKISMRGASKIIYGLSEEEQKELIKQISGSESGRVVSKEITELKKVIQSSREREEDLAKRLEHSQQVIKDLEASKTVEKIVEVEKKVQVVPEDYEQTKKEKKALESALNYSESKYEKEKERRSKLEDELRTIKEETPQMQEQKKLNMNVYLFRNTCDSFIKDVGGLAWLGDRIQEMSEEEQKIYFASASLVKSWAMAITQLFERMENTNG